MFIVADGGRSLLTCAPCNGASMRRRPMSPKIVALNWTNRRHRRRLQRVSKMSDRSHTVPTPEGEYFESSRFTGLSTLLGVIAVVEPGALRCRRVRESASIQLFLAVCVCIFLHALRRLFFLDDRASRHRRRVVGSCAASTGKHRGVARGDGDSFSFRSCCCDSISIRGWTFRRGTRRSWMPSARISI